MWWRIVLLSLAYLTLGAHFLRFGDMTWAALITAVPFLLFIRKRIVITLLQAGLVAGTFLVWTPTTYNLISLRMLFGQPWLRMAFILGAVMAGNLLTVCLAEKLKTTLNHSFAEQAN